MTFGCRSCHNNNCISFLQDFLVLSGSLYFLIVTSILFRRQSWNTVVAFSILHFSFFQKSHKNYNFITCTWYVTSIKLLSLFLLVGGIDGIHSNWLSQTFVWFMGMRFPPIAFSITSHSLVLSCAGDLYCIVWISRALIPVKKRMNKLMFYFLLCLNKCNRRATHGGRMQIF